MLLCIEYGILFVDTVDTKIKACKALNAIYVSQLRAGGPVIPGLLRPTGVKYGRNTRRVVMATRFTMVMNTISIYGRARTSLTERWQVLFSRYS